MDKKFKVNWTNIKGDCQSFTKPARQDFKSDLPLVTERKILTHFVIIQATGIKKYVCITWKFKFHLKMTCFNKKLNYLITPFL